MNRDEFIVKFPKTISEKYNVVFKNEDRDSITFFTEELNGNVESALKIIFDKNIVFEVVDSKLLNLKRNEFYSLDEDKLILNFL